MRNIVKMDYPRSRGYWVRFYRNKEKQAMYQKTFPIDKMKNWKLALKRAIRYRDKIKKILDHYYSLLPSGGPYCILKTVPLKNNKSGTVGVFRSHATYKKPYGTYTLKCWIVSYTMISKKPKVIRFYDHKCGGCEKAKKLAIKKRKEIEKEIIRKRLPFLLKK